ncbi:PilE-like protein [Elusimicrobium minutum Pei191]|uniref:PilE-like protein n=1 Tax=Elusimicrobium minutum (strain Pei191) TaxID=445932 RepID=B2KET9_ELUMP|nr:prepilin-type N-terminal cleavage/methylation domain-containing protein [Elusimicrobium minutum]ACC99035.1 PilE-like protein [Elusimicrobium minutum Pei191]
MKKGFTLIELLVVVLIIGILAAIALPQYNSAVAKARATEAFVNGKALNSAIQRWMLQNGAISATNRPKFEDLDIELSGVTYTTSYNARAKYWDYDTRETSITCIRSTMGTSPQSVIYEICFNANTNEIICLAELNKDNAEKLCKTLGGKERQKTGSWTYYTIAN